ncbi:MAG: hypothetical protein AAF353_04535 [Pseudomonadota bacterium]
MNDNPYQPPESDVELGDQFKRSVWWKIYFFFITIISALGFIFFLFDPNFGIAEMLSIASWVVATIGLYGFVFMKEIYKPKFWLYFLIYYIAFSLLYYFITKIDLRAGMSETMFYASSIFGWILALPGYYALYAYSKPARNKQHSA